MGFQRWAQPTLFSSLPVGSMCDFISFFTLGIRRGEHGKRVGSGNKGKGQWMGFFPSVDRHSGMHDLQLRTATCGMVHTEELIGALHHLSGDVMDCTCKGRRLKFAQRAVGELDMAMLLPRACDCHVAWMRVGETCR